MTEIIGIADDGLMRHLADFAHAAERHEWGGPCDGRLVVAEPHPGGVEPTISRALRKWMPARAFDAWRHQQSGRPVTTGAKTFTADDGVVTAVVYPIPDAASFLALAGHEMLEMARLAHERDAPPPNTNDEANGIVLLDEYVIERARLGIASRLGWPPSRLDVSPGLVSQTDDVVRLLHRLPGSGPPPHAFWLNWINLARVWAMVAGRADAGSMPERGELERWSRHALVDPVGWGGVHAALSQGYLHADADQRSRHRFAAAAVFEPIEVLGRAAWSESAPPAP